MYMYMYMYIYNYVLYIYIIIYVCVCACDSTCIPDYTWHSIAISCNILGRLLYVMLSQHSEYIAPTIVSNLILDIPRPSGAPNELKPRRVALFFRTSPTLAANVESYPEDFPWRIMMTRWLLMHHHVHRDTAFPRSWLSTTRHSSSWGSPYVDMIQGAVDRLLELVHPGLRMTIQRRKVGHPEISGYIGYMYIYNYIYIYHAHTHIYIYTYIYIYISMYWKNMWTYIW